MKIQTITSLPPNIKCFFDAALLQTPLQLEYLNTLFNIYSHIKKRAERLKKYPERYEIYLKKEKEFLNLYERTKTKKENKKTKGKNKTEGLFYSPSLPSRSLESLFKRLRYSYGYTTAKYR